MKKHAFTCFGYPNIKEWNKLVQNFKSQKKNVIVT